MPRYAVRFSVLMFALGFCASNTRAAGPAPEKPATNPAALPADPAMQATPKGALHYFDRMNAGGDVETALKFYQAGNEQEKKLARVMARVDVAAAKVERLLYEKFDKPAADAVMHAMRNETDEDIDAAAVVQTGDKARVEWKDAQTPYTLVRVNGVWKVDVSEVVKGFDETYTAEQFIATNEAAAAEFEKTAEELRSGKYPNAALLERAVKRRMEKLLGE